MIRRFSTPKCCVLGRETFSPTNISCISCRRQEVACPFGTIIAVSPQTNASAKEKSPSKAKQPNKTEAECGRRLSIEFPGCDIRYEALSLIIELDGERFGYRPDWVVLLPHGGVLCVEVKNAGYKHASYGRSKLAFAAARVSWPMFQFRWAVKDAGSWVLTDYKGDTGCPNCLI